VETFIPEDQHNGPRNSARLHGNAAENAAAQQIGKKNEDLFHFYVSFVWRFAFHFEGAYFRQLHGSLFGGFKSGRRGLLARAKNLFPVGPRCFHPGLN
jgi:hypothetical protein